MDFPGFRSDRFLARQEAMRLKRNAARDARVAAFEASQAQAPNTEPSAKLKARPDQAIKQAQKAEALKAQEAANLAKHLARVEKTKAAIVIRDAARAIRLVKREARLKQLLADEVARKAKREAIAAERRIKSKAKYELKKAKEIT